MTQEARPCTFTKLFALYHEFRAAGGKFEFELVRANGTKDVGPVRTIHLSGIHSDTLHIMTNEIHRRTLEGHVSIHSGGEYVFTCGEFGITEQDGVFTIGRTDVEGDRSSEDGLIARLQLENSAIPLATRERQRDGRSFVSVPTTAPAPA